uniref:B30.2/SPRY domain-containing protein n=1 Tax=Meloidogyne hapla TaxID=6305 RepID=A0A1I8C1J4_MELHA
MALLGQQMSIQMSPEIDKQMALFRQNFEKENQKLVATDNKLSSELSSARVMQFCHQFHVNISNVWQNVDCCEYKCIYSSPFLNRCKSGLSFVVVSSRNARASIEYIPSENPPAGIVTVHAEYPLLHANVYFEIKFGILTNEPNIMAIGLCSYDLDVVLWINKSQETTAYIASSKHGQVKLNMSFTTDDVFGCGRFSNNGNECIFFTKNGKQIGEIFYF